MANTKTQDQALHYLLHKEGERRFIYWLGGVRSGKSYGATQCFIQHAFENAEEGVTKLYMILGYTSPQVMTIYSNYFQEICKQEGLYCEISKATFDPHILVKDDKTGAQAKFICRGADCESKASAIQGLTLHGLLADEVANLNRATLHQAEARISEDAALRVYTSNKTSPYHWTVKYYCERIRERIIPGIILDAESRDNDNVNNAYLEERELEYEGDTLERFINNQYTLDEQPLYNIPVVPVDVDEVDWAPYYNIFLYVHEKGYEAIKAGYDIKNKRTVILSGQSFKLTDTITFHGGNRVCNVWINSGNPYLVADMRLEGYNVGCYSDHHEDWKTKVILRALQCEQLVISEDAAGLIEAVQLHTRAGYPEHQIINALDGMADYLRRNLRLTNMMSANTKSNLSKCF